MTCDTTNTIAARVSGPYLLCTTREGCDRPAIRLYFRYGPVNSIQAACYVHTGEQDTRVSDNEVDVTTLRLDPWRAVWNWKGSALTTLINWLGEPGMAALGVTKGVRDGR